MSDDPIQRQRDQFRGAQVVRLIEVDLCRGEGTEADPLRAVHVFYDLEGNYRGEYDPLRPKSAAGLPVGEKT